MKSAYEPIPWLATPNPPVVSATTGLGTGGGAGVHKGDDNGFGHVDVFVGPGYTAAGNVALQFPNTPPTLFLSADAGFGAIAQATVGNVVTISWTAANWNVPNALGGPKKIHYEWAVST